MSWERLLRVLRIHAVPLPELEPNPELEQAQKEVEQLHRKAERVLDDYAIANGERRQKQQRRQKR